MAKNNNQPMAPRNYATKFRQKYMVICDKNQSLWFYDDNEGVWCKDAEPIIEKILRQQYLSPKYARKGLVSEIMADLKSICFTNSGFPVSSWWYISFKNGMYDLKSGKFRKHSHQHYITTKLAVDYNPNVKVCPFVDYIFQGLVDQGDLSDLYELAAYCMVSTYANQEIFFLVGAGRNGKSVYTNILTMMLGRRNVSAVSLHHFQTNRFAGAELFSKYANISSELRYNDLNNTDQLKKLSGGDLIHAEKKFQNPFNFHNHAKLIFVTNEIPRTNDKTMAFYRRIRIIRFPNVFEGKREDKTLRDKITEKELQGLAYKCLQILKQMVKRNFTFTNQKQTSQIEQEYEKISNPIDTFIDQHCDFDEDGIIAKPDFKQCLDDWLRKTGQRIRKDKDIAVYMREKGIDDQKRKLYGTRKNAWAGIKWKQPVKGVKDVKGVIPKVTKRIL